MDMIHHLLQLTLLQILRLLLLNHFAESDNGVQGGTEGMADVGQKYRFQLLTLPGPLNLSEQFHLVITPDNEDTRHEDERERQYDNKEYNIHR